jgi:glycosyltransferase involved in cell wall biosynthesis
MKKNVIIVSLKFAPGLFKEFTLLGKNLTKKPGFPVTYILSKSYQKNALSHLENTFYISRSSSTKEMIEDSITYPFKLGRQLHKILTKDPPDLICAYNPHPLNYLVLKKAYQINSNSLRAIYLHEPYKPDKYLYGKLGSLYFQIVDFCQALSVKYANQIILPSPHAVELFKIRFPDFKGSIHLAPLLIPDTPVNPQPRQFFTFAGTVNAGKGLDTFCQLIEHVASLNLNYRFRICTTSNIRSYINSLSEAAKKITLIENPKVISDRDMFQVHAESKAFFLLHTTATQSGAMPVAFMHGTPVIARDITAFSQFIDDGKNSCLVPKNCTPQDLLEAMQYVEANQTQLSVAARQTYENLFSDRNWEKNYSWLLHYFSEK